MHIPEHDYKRIKHVHAPGDFHEFTFSCYHQKNLLVDDTVRVLLSRSIDRAGDRFQFCLVAFVFMPNHVHLLTFTAEQAPNIDGYLSAIKQPFSSRIKKHWQRTNSALVNELTIRERPNKTTFRFWQEGPGYDRNLNQPVAIVGAIDYFHLNPVRKSYCEKAVDWRWSSDKYFSDPMSPVDEALPRVYPLPFGSLD